MTLKDKIIHEPPKLFLLEGILGMLVAAVFETINTFKGEKHNSFRRKVDQFLDVLAEAQRDWRQKVLFGLHDTGILKGKIKTILLCYRDQYPGGAGTFLEGVKWE